MVMLFSTYSCHVVGVLELIIITSFRKITTENAVNSSCLFYFPARAAFRAAVAGTLVAIFSDFGRDLQEERSQKILQESLKRLYEGVH